MKCQKCLEPLQDSDDFCPECGSPRPTNHTCIHCGVPVKIQEKFCMSCGKCLELMCPCGASLKPLQKFCHKCGKPVKVPALKLICIHCGADIEETQKFCCNCGTPVQGTSTRETPFCKSSNDNSQNKQHNNGSAKKQVLRDYIADDSQTKEACVTREVDKIIESGGETHEDAVCEELEYDNKVVFSDDVSTTSKDVTSDIQPTEQDESLNLSGSQNETQLDSTSAPQQSESELATPDLQGSEKQEVQHEITNDVQQSESEFETLNSQGSDKQDVQSSYSELTIPDLQVSDKQEAQPDVISYVQQSELELGTPDLQSSEKQEEEAQHVTTSDVQQSELGTPNLQGSDRRDDEQSSYFELATPDLQVSDKQEEEAEPDVINDVQRSELELGTPDMQGSEKQEEEAQHDITNDVQQSESELETVNSQGSDKRDGEIPSDTTSDVQQSELGTPNLQGSDRRDEETPSDTTSDVHSSYSELATPDLEVSDKQEEEAQPDITSDVQKSELELGTSDLQGSERRDGETLSDSTSDVQSSYSELATPDLEISDKQEEEAQPDVINDVQRSELELGIPDMQDSEKQEEAQHNITNDVQQSESELETVNSQGSDKRDGEIPSDTTSDVQQSELGIDVQSSYSELSTPDLQVSDKQEEAQPHLHYFDRRHVETPSDTTSDAQPSGPGKEVDNIPSLSETAKTQETPLNEQTEHEDISVTEGSSESLDTGTGNPNADEDSNDSGRSRKEMKRLDSQEKKQSPEAEKETAFVVFHVVISKKFKQLKKNNCQVFLVLKPNENKPQPDNMVKMTQKSTSPECGELYEVSIEMSKVPQFLNYNYYIIVDDQYHWEKIYHHNGEKYNSGIRRKLHILDKTETLNVYDWMAYPDHLGGMLDEFWRWTGRKTSSDSIFYKDIVHAWRLFLPSPKTIMDALCTNVESHGQNATDILQMIDSISRRTPFCVKQCDWKESMKECLEEVLLEPLLKHLEGTTDSDQRTVVMAMFLLYLVEKIQSSIAPCDKNIVFKALLIKPNLKERTCPDLQYLTKHFPDMKRNKKLLRKFLSGDVRGINPVWILCIPLLHLLCGDSKEFHPLPASENHRTEEWWGIQMVVEQCHHTKTSDWSVPVEDMYQHLSEAFQADELMLRTFVATLNLRQLLDFLAVKVLPLEIVMASIFFHLHTDQKARELQHQMEMVDILRKMATVVKTEITSNRITSEREMRCWKLRAAIGVDLLREVIKIRASAFLIHSVFLLELSVISVLTSGSGYETRSGPSIQDTIQSTYSFLDKWLHSFIPPEQNYRQMMEESIQAAKEVPNEEVQKQLTERLSEHIKWYIDKMPPVNRLLYCLDLQKDQSCLNEIIASCEMTYLERALNLMEADKAMFGLSEECVQGYKYLLRDKIEELFETNWNEKFPGRHGLYELVFIWRPLLIFMNALQMNPVFTRSFTPKVAGYVEKCSTFLDKTMTEICDGSIKIEHLRWLLDHHEQFNIVVQTLRRDSRQYLQALQLRKKELEDFQAICTDVNHALCLCQHFINTDDFHDIIRAFQQFESNITSYEVVVICKHPALPDSTHADSYKPQICIPFIPECFQPFLTHLGECRNSAVFQHMLEKSARSKNISRTDKGWDVMVSVWQEAENEWHKACQAMRTGDVTREDAEKLFSVIEENHEWVEKCKNEMKRMAGEGERTWVEKRIKQFQCLRQLRTQREVAFVLCQIKGEFGFTGDVENIRNIQKVDMTQPIGKLDMEVVVTSRVLQDIDKKSLTCFKHFGSESCSKFVSWVRETMAGDGMKELKVFVDMAMNYVGDEPKEMDKVRNLRAVITGYAPLIFQTGELTFVDRCSQVAKNIQADHELPKKLESTVALMDWFDKIHKFHGSVEKTAMAQVDNITTAGILKIGRLQSHTKKRMDLGFNEVICLEVLEDRKVESKIYSYQDLLDLQSRLMLVAGQEDESKSSIERFISVMDSVERLVKTYIKLCQEGCLLFLNWTVKFFFGIRGVCCIVEFFQGANTVKQLKGRQESSTLEGYMAMVANFLDNSLVSWLDYIAKQRKDCHNLNMFTMDQLVFLQEQLALAKKSHGVSSHVFPLLSLLLPECGPDSLQAAMKQADEMLFLQREAEAEGDGIDTDKKAETVAIFIQHMRANGFSKKLAVCALKADVSPTDLMEGLKWCMEHVDDEDNDEKEKCGDAIDSKSHGSSHLEGILTSALQLLDSVSGSAMSLELLREKLFETWSQFLSRVKFSGEDYLSLHQLSTILKVLNEMRTNKLNRKLPPPMEANVPNLIICPKSEVLKTVTSLYAFTENADLPQPDEVLLCTPHTTKEEVKMFLQRVFSATSSHMGKIHCLAFADSLDYEVGKCAEKHIKEFINTTEPLYQLVVVCTSENEFNARITALLERFRRQPPITADDPNKIRDYLTCKFTVPDNVQPHQSAACVDPDRLCVRVVKSARSGMGKTLYKKRQAAKLKALLEEEDSNDGSDGAEDNSEDPDDCEDGKPGKVKQQQVDVTVPLYGKQVNSHQVADILLRRLPPCCDRRARLIHLDIAYEVQEGVDLLLYNLLVLGCITDGHGHVWQRLPSDLYLVETMPLLEHSETQEKKLLHQIFSILPSLMCCSPSESLQILENKQERKNGYHGLLFDSKEFESTVFQRPFHYLNSLNIPGDPKPFNHQEVAQIRRQAACLKILLKHCRVDNPSWSEIYHFVSFLNKQLEDFEHSVFCRSDLSQDLPGFPAFVLKFLIHMSKDFATRSIMMAEESLPVLSSVTDSEDREGFDRRDELKQYQMHRTWESSPHPYIFFNPDQNSMTFLGFTVDHLSCDLLDQVGTVLEKRIMKRTLYHTLITNEVPLSEDFNCLPRDEKLKRLYQVMGVPASEMNVDPDNTYELTTDNAKKILAIYMRFRCNIPVVIMGETGCGKTRLVQFLCALQIPKAKPTNPMVIMKVHGGTTAEDIHKKVREAEAIAKATKECTEQNSGAGAPRPIYTVLFFDEANTTEAIGAIKEVMCDRAMNGRPIKLHENLKMVAACNPYRRHSEVVIKRLEKAGLGYHVSAEKTCDKLGRVPMRQLVYRVQPLPQSMLPLVWDFGQLDAKTERMYIWQMVLRYGREQFKDLSPADLETLCSVLAKAQKFMRKLKDECSFVSLRDANRALMVTGWFLQQTELLSNVTLTQTSGPVDNITKSLVLALAVCYRASLLVKPAFGNAVCKALHPRFSLPRGPEDFECIISSCQTVLLEDVKLGEKIAHNQALKENIFMMVVCIELRIPLFLVGKPGSSKSLAKAIVADAMQGAQATGKLFKIFKETQMVSFQCSPLATADGILGTFRQCAHIQHGKDRNKFVAVAVLDEIGLAEDSPKMPLKALHPLLEEGYEVEKVAFIGISNWALDPAKMNRGILVQRDVPDLKELTGTAKSICASGEEEVLQLVNSLVEKLAQAYLGVFQKATHRREFFGLRDFYSLVKMVHAIATHKKRKLTRDEFKAVVRRNFGGLEDVDPVEIFEKHLSIDDTSGSTVEGGIDSSYAGLLKMALQGDQWSGESRYLLLLTENYGGLHILTDNQLAGQSVVTIFGSSFPRDQEYTQVCLNINHIKVCMETGKTVVLLNLDSLYESLYDALNQYYSYLASARYVDLGLGTHRVKCKVDTNFRLIVVAEKQTVYDKFPIPLINRLEKHFLTISGLLSEKQRSLLKQLSKWMDTVAQQGRVAGKLAVGNVFIGYHEDMPASTVLQAWDFYIPPEHILTSASEQQILNDCKRTLLWCATPDAIIRLQDEWCSQEYFCQQQHDSLVDYLQVQLQAAKDGDCFKAQVTTHSKLLTDSETEDLQQQLPGFSFTLVSLQAFQTEQQFRHQLSLFLSEKSRHPKVLLVQCERGNQNQDLLQCSQYIVQSLWPSCACNHHILFIVQLPQVLSIAFSGFMGGAWHCAHVDDLRNPANPVPSVLELQTASPAQLLSLGLLSPSDQEEIPTASPNVSLSLELACCLLTNCVQGAVARIRDSDKASTRSIERIKLLRHFMDKCDGPFFTGILRLVSSVLREKESADAPRRNACQWLSDKAANPERVKKAGTMRRAWMQCLEDLMVPVLAGVVAYLDTNCNLDLLLGDTWVLQLWFNILNNPELCEVCYLDLVTMSRQQMQLKEFVCQNTFLAYDSVSPSFPFSWIIAKLINTFLTNTPVSESDYEREDAAIEALAKSAVGHHLREIATRDDIAEQCVQRYLADLLHVDFRLNPQQHALLMQCVTAALKQERMEVQSFEVIRAMVKMHSILATVQPRLQAVLDLAACHPQAIQNLQEKRLDPETFGPDHQPELVEDILLLEILMDELNVQQNQLITEDKCRRWLDCYNILAPVISRVLKDADYHMSLAARPNREDDAETEQRKSWLDYGPWCHNHLISIKSLWTKVCVVKLFIDYMSPLLEGSEQVQKTSINYNLLWNWLPEITNLKSKETLVRVDKYLKVTNSKMVKKLLGNVAKCSHCCIKLEGPPTVLPCTHRMCDMCYRQVTTSHQCPDCHRAVPVDFNPDTSTGCDPDAVDELLHFQQQTSAFLMAVVSQLSFAGQEPPEPEAVEHIFSYIIRRVTGVTTMQTQKLTLREDQMDASPVLRSFILRLLLKYSWNEVSAHITQFLDDAKCLIHDHVADKTDSKAVLTELSLLIIHCTESLEYEVHVTTADQDTDASIHNYCQQIKDQLHCVRRELEESPLELQTLIAIGKVRHALTCCASLLYTHVIEPTDWNGLDRDLKDLFTEVLGVCTFISSNWPRDFLVKQVCRDFGVDAYNTLVQRAVTERCLQWIKLDNVEQCEEVADRYLMCGADYHTVRDEVIKEIRGQENQLIMRLSELQCRDETKQYFLLLTLHREVLMAFLTASDHTKAAAKDKARILVQSRRVHIDEAFALQIVNNTLGTDGTALNMNRNQSLADQSLVCFLIHLWVALRTHQQQRHPLAPLRILIDHPEQMKNSFLPTMPEDNVNEIIQALGIDHSKTLDDYNEGHETAKIWECPNGHRYIIGDCGNPNARSRCPECQSAIGGARYNEAIYGNKMAQLTDQTRPGHILGAAEDRSLEALPERGMSAAACALLRLLTHAVLYISACQPGQAAVITELVQPPAREDVTQFFRKHLHKDLQVLQHVLGRCCDEVYLLLHHLCHQLHITRADLGWINLKSKQNRENWEKRFTEKYIQPVLRQTDDIIKQGTNMLLSDTRQGENQLLNLVFEVGDEDRDSDDKLQHTAAPWKYRTRITVDHFFRQFQLQYQGNNETLQVLRLFLEESHHLRALHFLPDILTLQHRLLKRLRHRLTRIDMSKTTIKDMMDKQEIPELLKLLELFSKTWDIVKDFLRNHFCVAEEGKIVQLPKECQAISISDGSPVGVLLPDSEGPGRCAYLLVHYLLVQHNHFMERYCPHTRCKFEQLPEVPLNMITRHHLVSYSPQTDLLPLVLAHCSYSLHLGHGDSTTSTKLDYDFQGFELQLRNTLLLGKPRIHRGPRGEIEIETMSYCADTTNSKLINRLREKVNQEELEVHVQHQIIIEFRDNLADICQTIDTINTTLTFMLTLKVTGDMLLHDFMVNTLLMKDSEGLKHSKKAQQHCRMKHVQSLWLLLCLQRARILAMHKQEAFDEQGADLRKELTEIQIDELDNTLRRLTPDCLELLLTQIYLCTMLDLIGHSHDIDFADPDNYSLKFLLNNSLEFPLYHRRTGVNHQLTAEDLKTFPESVLASQTIPAWTHVLMHLSQRRQ